MPSSVRSGSEALRRRGGQTTGRSAQTERAADPQQVHVPARDGAEATTGWHRELLVHAHAVLFGSLQASRLHRPIGRCLVFTRSTPPQEEGCCPASRGLSLELMTWVEPSLLEDSGKSAPRYFSYAETPPQGHRGRGL